MNWDMVLAELEAKVTQLEHRLDEGLWRDLDALPFAPADVEAEMTPGQRERAVALLERVASCKRRLAAAGDGPGDAAARPGARVRADAAAR